jgi:phosphoribosyl 1,2-cyclic phosphate phosphodiesterase
VSTLIFLGTGTSSGIPVLGCTCATCCSDDPRDRRFRTSAYITTDAGTNILIDVSPDFRLQALRHQIHWLDGVLITHAHNDHIGGLDELRQINFMMKQHVGVYGNALSLHNIRSRYNYIFEETTQRGGGKPHLELHRVEPQRTFMIAEQMIRPFEVWHGRIAILGYRLNGLTYITDASGLTPVTLQQLHDTDTLVINALRFRPHRTHFNLEQTLAIIAQVQPRVAYLVHMTHDIKHAEVEKSLPDNVYFAYDNLEITV